MPCHFVRFGGCDFKCEWCDTPAAVLPQAVRAAERRTAPEIVQIVASLAPGPEWVVISGGNPVLYDLTDVVEGLHTHGYKVAVETQGSRWKDWLKDVDRLCVSPKPPSSGMPGTVCDEIHSVLSESRTGDKVFLKVVVFDNLDYEYAQWVRKEYPDVTMYVSAGNDAGKTVGNPGRVDERTQEQIIVDLTAKARWLSNRLIVDPSMSDVGVQAQLHVLMWGNELGR